MGCMSTRRLAHCALPGRQPVRCDNCIAELLGLGKWEPHSLQKARAGLAPGRHGAGGGTLPPAGAIGAGAGGSSWGVGTAADILAVHTLLCTSRQEVRSRRRQMLGPYPSVLERVAAQPFPWQLCKVESKPASSSAGGNALMHGSWRINSSARAQLVAAISKDAGRERGGGESVAAGGDGWEEIFW